MSEPSDIQHTAAQHLQGLRQILTSLPPSQRVNITSFWKDVRTSLNDQDALITSLQQQLAAASIPPMTPVRPPTSNSVAVIRDIVEQAIVSAAQQKDEISTTIDAIYDLDPAWAMAFIRRQKNIHLSNASELGCWVSGNAAAHQTGYMKMNMRNTVGPRGQKFDVQPYGHQMGVVASGYGLQLCLTTDGQYHVSHLCHNPACFNPEHLVVEEQELNKARNSCHNSFIVKTPDGTMIHPCTHWREGRRLQCILPRREIPGAGRGQWIDMAGNGPVIRTGRSNQ